MAKCWEQGGCSSHSRPPSRAGDHTSLGREPYSLPVRLCSPVPHPTFRLPWMGVVARLSWEPSPWPGLEEPEPEDFYLEEGCGWDLEGPSIQ